MDERLDAVRLREMHPTSPVRVHFVNDQGECQTRRLTLQVALGRSFLDVTLGRGARGMYIEGVPVLYRCDRCECAVLSGEGDSTGDGMLLCRACREQYEALADVGAGSAAAACGTAVPPESPELPPGNSGLPEPAREVSPDKVVLRMHCAECGWRASPSVSDLLDSGVPICPEHGCDLVLDRVVVP